MTKRILIVIAMILALKGAPGMAAEGKVTVRQIGGQAELGTAEILGVSAGEFRPELWESGKLHFVADVRRPLIEPRKRGLYRNIYAPSAVEVEGGWRLFYGAWDGVDTGNDRIYSALTADFVDFTDRHTVIEHGDFQHCCNVNALRLPTGEFRLVCTVYPDAKGLNKPALFTSPDGKVWNGGAEPYAARMADIIDVQGYDKYADADINGMNVILFEDGVYRLYFNNFKDWGKVFRATLKEGKHFDFEGTALEFGACVNDVKKFVVDEKPWYLMGLHMNGNTLWYSLSKDGRKFDAPRELGKSLDEKDRYMVAVGWIVKGKRLLGFLYGAGEWQGLDRNRLWGRWLQKKVTFVAEDGTRYEPTAALGPDRQLLTIPRGKSVKGHFEVTAEDGTTLLQTNAPGELMSGGVYQVGE